LDSEDDVDGEGMVEEGEEEDPEDEEEEEPPRPKKDILGDDTPDFPGRCCIDGGWRRCLIRCVTCFV